MERGESAGGPGDGTTTGTTTTTTTTTTAAAATGASAATEGTKRTSGSAGIGDYLYVRTVGQGQFGKVKLATHKKTGRKVAIKQINKLNLTADTVKMVKREVQIMKMLWHPNIIRLYEVIETPSHLHLVMEYAPGGEVMDFILAKGRLSETTACKFFSQTAFALQYCHYQKTVHRDVKGKKKKKKMIFVLVLLRLLN